MKLVHKRILIMFSLALNIGFVIMAITMAYQHSKSFHERSWQELVRMVHRLQLTEAAESEVMGTITQFRVRLEGYDRDVKEAHSNIMLTLAGEGPVDRAELHRLFEAAEQREKIKNRAFEAHVLELREQLGHEKGALFFSFLLEHLKADDEFPHR